MSKACCGYRQKGKNLLIFSMGFLSALILPYRCLLAVICTVLLITAIILIEL